MPKRSRHSRPHLPRVALLVETQGASGRDMLRGIARYVRESGPWDLHLEQRMQQFVEGWIPKWIKGWDGDGVIGRFETQSVISATRALGVPAVNLLGSGRVNTFPRVYTDNGAIGTLAAQHLLERGFKQFGFIGGRGANWSGARLDAFSRAVGAQGHACSVMEIASFQDLFEKWDDFVDKAADWIRGLPKPVGIMLCYDQLGPPVAQACRQVGVAVPEDVALIGADNDEPICTICNPPLTTVCPNHEEVGYQAALLLDRLMSGQAPPSEPVRVAPRGVIVRQSTEIAAIDDPIVSQALSTIRERACSGVTVRELYETSAVSGTALQRRFRAVVGHSLHEEIARVQLLKAQDLLRNTALPIRTVAAKAGFKHQEYMGAVFKSRLSLTPRQYRQQFHGASEHPED